MNKLTQISGLNNKLGQNSRTGSNISIFVPDELIQEVTQYYVEVKANKETLGKVKKIELVIYEESDMAEVNTIEALLKRIDELNEFIDNLDTVVKNSESLIDSVVIEEDEVPKLKSLKCTCGKTYEWKNVKWDEGYSNITHFCDCGLRIIGGEELVMMVSLWDRAKNNTSLLKLFIENVLEEEFTEAPKEHLPANQIDLPLYKDDKKQEVARVGIDKKCECGSNCFVKGICSNCGGVE